MTLRLIDGKLLWELHATHGVALETTLFIFAERNLVPTWNRIFEFAEKDGTNILRMRDRIIRAVRDSYSYEIANEIERRMYLLIP